MRNVEEARLYFREGTRALGEANRSATALWQAWGLLERDQVRPRTPDPPHLPQPSTGFCFKQRTHTHTHTHTTRTVELRKRERTPVVASGGVEVKGCLTVLCAKSQLVAISPS